MTDNVFGIILAGGRGTRMGNAERPKQFLEIGGKPIIIHTIEKFAVQPDFEKIIVLCPKAWIEHTRDLIRKHIALRDRIVVIEGGASRNETLMNAITVIENAGDLDDETIIVTHDAVRPFVTERMITENIAAAKKTGACETAFPATDTIIETDDGQFVTNVPDRSRLWMTQTPQSFRAKKLRELYLGLSDSEKEVLTDAARIYVMKGEPVEIVRGESWNIKITYPQDLEIAEAILRRTAESR